MQGVILLNPSLENLFQLMDSISTDLRMDYFGDNGQHILNRVIRLQIDYIEKIASRGSPVRVIDSIGLTDTELQDTIQATVPSMISDFVANSG